MIKKDIKQDITILCYGNRQAKNIPKLIITK